MASGEAGVQHHSGEDMRWKKDLISQLRERNRSQTYCFHDLISLRKSHIITFLLVVSYYVC